MAAASVWWWRPEPTASELDQTRQITEEARAAAARGHYIHPPPDRPDEPTAIAKVLELEAIEGAAEATADEAAAGLRDEMADALVALGDRYFERPGGPPFAVDFYAAALVFDPTRQAARDRVTWTPGQLADLAAKAERGGFSEAELVAAEPLAVLADPDPARREEKLRAFEGRPSASIASRSRLAGLASSESGVDARPEPIARSTPSPSPPAPESREPAIAVPVEPIASTASAEAAKPTPPPEAPTEPDAAPRAPDPSAARRESDAGTAALRAGRLGEATAAFHKALEHDRRDVRALSGLAEVHFERSEYREAAKFAKLATTYAPKSSGSWIMLGDARVKLLEYADARVAYEKARGLGAQAADARLERLARLVGG